MYNKNKLLNKKKKKWNCCERDKKNVKKNDNENVKNDKNWFHILWIHLTNPQTQLKLN